MSVANASQRGTRTPSAGIWSAIAAAVVFVLAYVSPVQYVDSDPAIALVASQALVDHGTLTLDPYRSSDQSAYWLYGDYRIRRITGGTYYYSIGVPIVSAPAVWVANRFGWHMLDQRQEFALQNILSALSVALLFLVLVRLCGVFVGSRASLVIAAVSTLGTSIMSTGATALWTTNYALIFVALALTGLARGRAEASSIGGVTTALLLVAAAYLCRPAMGLFGVACLVYFMADRNRDIARAAIAVLGAVVLVVAATWIAPPRLLHGYYSPGRLWPESPLGPGLYNLLLSPSRGLFVFSPFLLLVAAGAIWRLSSLRRQRLFWLSATWIVLHVVFSAVKRGKWWGGYSFGPRALVDIIPAFVVLTCLLWAWIEQHGSPALRRRVMAGYLVLGVAAVAVHTGQGLFNPATQQWNVSPDIDSFPEYALSWKYPQFLATPAMLARRLDEHQRAERLARIRRLGPYRMGAVIAHNSTDAVFVDWYEPEAAWRWSRGASSSIVLKPAEVDPRRPYVLEILAGSLGTQRVSVSLDGTPLDTFELFESPARRLVVVPGRLLAGEGERTITLDMSAPSSTPADSRQLAVSLRELRLSPLPEGFDGVRFADDRYFGDGFSGAEAGWRWTDGSRAEMTYPTGEFVPASDYVLEVRAFSFGRQRVDLSVNDQLIGTVTFPGATETVATLEIPRATLRAERINHIGFTLPDAGRAPNDPRLLGLAVMTVRIAPAAPPDDRPR